MEISEKISDEMNSTEISNKPSIQGAAKAVKRERSFKLSLPTLVSGVNAQGQEFKEKTHITSISSQNALFLLKSKVLIGTPLLLSLDVPKTLILENRLSLQLSGEVILVKHGTDGIKKQLVALQLNRSFKIHPKYSAS